MTRTPPPPDRWQAAAARAADRLLTRHGGSIEDAAAEARRYQLQYSPGTASWAHYDLVLALITGDDKRGT